MSQETLKSFDPEHFKLEFDDKTKQLAAASELHRMFLGPELSEEEVQYQSKKFDGLYREVLTMLAAACIDSGRDPLVFEKVTEFMRLTITPDNDIPVFDDRGAGALKDFTDELLKQSSKSEESGTRKEIESVLNHS